MRVAMKVSPNSGMTWSLISVDCLSCSFWRFCLKKGSKNSVILNEYPMPIQIMSKFVTSKTLIFSIMCWSKMRYWGTGHQWVCKGLWNPSTPTPWLQGITSVTQLTDELNHEPPPLQDPGQFIAILSLKHAQKGMHQFLGQLSQMECKWKLIHRL